MRLIWPPLLISLILWLALTDPRGLSRGIGIGLIIGLGALIGRCLRAGRSRARLKHQTRPSSDERA